jgi:hypothetical protein
MGLLDLFKLAKLTIKVYSDPARTPPHTKAVEVMFNPSTFSLKYVNTFASGRGIGRAGNTARFANNQPQVLSLSLIMDGTGVGDFGIATLLGAGSPSVKDRVQEFMTHCFHLVEAKHQPNFLVIEWGKGPLTSFRCRLQSVDINYTSFDRDGSPLRAELRTGFLEDPDVRERPLSSPDLTHTRVVNAGDTLPLLCLSIYGSPHHYLRVARVNGLDNFRQLVPGQVLMFPPFERGQRQTPEVAPAAPRRRGSSPA